jgi:hypothetical protein
VTPLAAVLSLTAWCIGMAAATVGIWWLSAIFGVLAVATAARLLPFVFGRATAGGVYLTPAGVEHHFGVRTTFLPWDGFEVPLLRVPFRLQRGLGAMETKNFPYDIPMDVTDQVRDGGISVPTPYLAIEAADLVTLLTMYAGLPRRQAHLGTSRSLEWQPYRSSPTDHRRGSQDHP